MFERVRDLNLVLRFVIYMYILEDFVRIKREFCVCECAVTYKLDQIERHMIHFSAVV